MSHQLTGCLLFRLASLPTENRTVLEVNRSCVGEILVSQMYAALATVNELGKDMQEERGRSYKRNSLGCCRLLFSFTSEFLRVLTFSAISKMVHSSTFSISQASHG